MEYGTAGRQTRRGYWADFFELSFLYLLIAHLGWVFEKVGRYILYDSVADRGFLSMPFCPIYATCVIGAYILFGTPKEVRILGIRVRCPKFLSAAIYFVCCVLFASLVELLVGGVFFGAAGIRLWDYGERVMNLGGHICLSYSLLWGALMTLFMLIFWQGARNIARRIPQKKLVGLCLSVYSLMLADFIFNLFYLYRTGSHFNLM